METMIREYLREVSPVIELRKDGKPSQGAPIGVMLASLKDNKLSFGWSVLHENDLWDKHRGMLIATNRLKNFDPDVENVLIVPECMYEMMERFIERAERYFRIKSNVKVLDGFALSTNYHNGK